MHQTLHTHLPMQEQLHTCPLQAMLCLSCHNSSCGAALMMMYFLKVWDLTGGGALASLIMGMTVSQLWSKGKPGILAKRADPHYAKGAEHLIGIFWRLIAQPLLFGLAGSGVPIDVHMRVHVTVLVRGPMHPRAGVRGSSALQGRIPALV